MKRIISIVFALALVLALSLATVVPVGATSTWYVDPTGTDDGSHGTGPGTAAWQTIQYAVSHVGPGDIITVGPGTYIMGQIVISQGLTIIGGSPKPVINPTGNLPGTLAGNAWILVNAGVTFTLRDVVLDGNPFFVYTAIRNHGFTTLDNVDFRNIQMSVSGTPYRGYAVVTFGGTVPGGWGTDSHGAGGLASTLSVTGCTFQQIGRDGVLVKGTQATASISGCTYTGHGTGDWLEYGVEVGAGGVATITGNTITGCGISGTAWSSAAVAVTDAYGPGSAATITGNNLTGNEHGIAAAYNATDASVVTAHFNNISGNVEGIHTPSTVVTTDGECNWWGDASGPTHSGNPGGIGDPATDFVDYTPWLTEAYAPQKSVTPTTGGTASFTPGQGSIESLTVVPPPATPPVTLPYGMFNFTVCCFTGATATLNIMLPGPVPVGTKWYKYNAGAWDALPIGDDNGDAFITVTLTDNNPIHDEDPTVGQIIDQGGPGYPGAVGWETYPVSKARVLLPWIALLAAFILVASLLVLRRHRAQT